MSASIYSAPPLRGTAKRPVRNPLADRAKSATLNQTESETNHAKHGSDRTDGKEHQARRDPGSGGAFRQHRGRAGGMYLSLTLGIAMFILAGIALIGFMVVRIWRWWMHG